MSVHVIIRIIRIIMISCLLLLADEEECENGTHNCALHAHCINTFGSFYCTCAHGYSGDGVQCSGKEATYCLTDLLESTAVKFHGS